MTYTYPHTIENGAGERLTFIRRIQDPAGDRLEVESLVKHRLSAGRRVAAVRRAR